MRFWWSSESSAGPNFWELLPPRKECSGGAAKLYFEGTLTSRLASAASVVTSTELGYLTKENKCIVSSHHRNEELLNITDAARVTHMHQKFSPYTPCKHLPKARYIVSGAVHYTYTSVVYTDYASVTYYRWGIYCV